MKPKAVVTSALPYANGEIHLGHISSTYLPADVTVRHLRQRGVEAYYVCATDDYGTPILVQSERESKSPQEYVAQWHERDLKDFQSLDIRFDAFSSTSAEHSAKFVQECFEALNKAGHIYEKEIEQLYCDKDSMFLPDRYVRGTCPHCHATDQYSDLCESCGKVPEQILDPHCSLCGQSPKLKSTTHYFFALSHFADKIHSWLESDSRLQSDVKNYVLEWIKQGISDWDITRDISWGVPIPGDDAGRVFYGWFDNHLSYISTTLEMLDKKGIDGTKFWNEADIYHFIGKDIVYHHYMFLPAIRLGLGEKFKLPDFMPVRGHLKLEGKKISKSRGWYIGLRDFVSHFEADYLRFYLLLVSSYSQDDLNFDWNDFGARINSELIGNIGNFVNRTLSFTAKSFEGKIPSPDVTGDEHEKAKAKIENLAASLGAQLESGHLDKALRSILAFSAGFNQYFQHCEPWKGAKGSSSCIYYSVNAVRSLAITLYPFVPSSAQRIWLQLGLEGKVEDATWDSASEVGLEGHHIGAPSALFERVDAKKIESLKASLGDTSEK